MKILIFTSDYPDKRRNAFIFVKQLVDEFARQGNECCVIAPYSVTHNRRMCSLKEVVEIEGGRHVTILRPNYISFSNIRFGSIELTPFFRKLAIRSALKKVPFIPDISYAHFWRSAYEAFDYSKKNSIPLFLATGEDNISFGNNLSERRIKEFVDYVSGVICVSTPKKRESLSKGLTTEDKCIVVPNAFNQNLFFPRERTALRKKYGIDCDKFIISFVGSFSNRKGVTRVSDAISSLNDPSVCSFFIGGKIRGKKLKPACKGILYEGGMPHSKIPDYLNMSDVFVLPTLSEGCSNAIVEAIGCGLPVISSNIDFNLDILNQTNSILVDPMDIGEIADAINKLKMDPRLRKTLSLGSIAMSRRLTIEDRAKTILNFITSKLDERIIIK